MRTTGAVLAVLLVAGTSFWLFGTPDGGGSGAGERPGDPGRSSDVAPPELAGRDRPPPPAPPGPFDAIVARTGSTDEDERHAAVRELKRLHAAGQVPFAQVVAWATLEVPEGRANELSGWALSVIAADKARARGFLPEILASGLGASETRQAAIGRFLGALGGVRAQDVAAVARLFEHEASTYGLKRELVSALDDLGPALLPAAGGLIEFATAVLRQRAESAREALAAGIHVSWDHVEYDIERLLGAIGPDVVPLLRARLEAALAAQAQENGRDRLSLSRQPVDLLASALAEAGDTGVTVLIELLDHTDARVRRDLLYALEDVKGPHEGVRTAALAALGDASASVRGRAAGILARHGEASVPALLRALADRNESVRKAAAGSLRQLDVDPAQALEPLLAMLDAESDDFAKLEAAETLASLGAGALPALPRLIAHTAHEDEWFRVRFAGAVAALARQDPAAFIARWSDAAPAVRRGMVRVLELLLESKTTPPAKAPAVDPRFLELTQLAIADADLYVQVHAARLLALRGSGTRTSLPVLPVLVDGFRARDGHVRMIATEGLAAIGLPALSLLPEMLERIVREDLHRDTGGHSDRSEESALDEALRILGPHDLPRMFALLDHDTWNLSYAAQAAFRAAGERGYAWLANAWPGARPGQKREALDLARSAFFAKGEAAGPSRAAARRLARAALGDAEAEIRFYAAHALERDTDSQAERMQVLAALLEGVPPELTQRAAYQLSGLGAKAAPIEPQLAPHRAHPDEDVRRIVVRLLEAIEDAR